MLLTNFKIKLELELKFKLKLKFKMEKGSRRTLKLDQSEIDLLQEFYKRFEGDQKVLI